MSESKNIGYQTSLTPFYSRGLVIDCNNWVREIMYSRTNWYPRKPATSSW